MDCVGDWDRVAGGDASCGSGGGGGGCISEEVKGGGGGEGESLVFKFMFDVRYFVTSSI